MLQTVITFNPFLPPAPPPRFCQSHSAPFRPISIHRARSSPWTALHVSRTWSFSSSPLTPAFSPSARSWRIRLSASERLTAVGRDDCRWSRIGCSCADSSDADEKDREARWDRRLSAASEAIAGAPLICTFVSFAVHAPVALDANMERGADLHRFDSVVCLVWRLDGNPLDFMTGYISCAFMTTKPAGTAHGSKSWSTISTLSDESRRIDVIMSGKGFLPEGAWSTILSWV